MIRRLLIAALLTLCAACGGGGTAATPSASSKAVTLGFSAWPGWVPWQIAQEKGLFAKNGVEVELKYFDSYTDSLTALATGNIDANSQTLNDTLASVSGGAKQTVVLVNDNSTGNDQIIARPGITSVAQLKGKTVAAEQGTVDHYLLLLALRKAGLTQADITFKPLLTDAAAAAFKAGQVDAVGAFAPFTTTALELPGSTAIATSKDFPGAIPDHLVVTREFAASRPEAVQGLVKTWFDTLAWIGANKAEARTIMAKRAGVSEQAYADYDAGTTILSLADNLKAFSSGSLERQAKEIAAFLTESGLADTAPPLDGLLDPRFVQGASS
ncbi:ABC transporter substrate-binding protein [Nonomuraea sp. H19]|uniref:ABC transporter substrate-binding protein n=1 Tax=Nonomuraea sp. H19 TaxID=3452206 RepID=UPI003F8C8C9B